MSLDDSGAKQPLTAPSTKNEMAGLIASKDWSTTALGNPNNWSPSLKLIVGIITASRFPMAVRWGPEFILMCPPGVPENKSGFPPDHNLLNKLHY